VSHLESLRQRREALMSDDTRGSLARDLLIDEETLLAAQTKARTLYDHASELSAAGRHEEGLPHAQRARELAPHEAAPWLLEAILLLRLAQQKSSIQSARTASEHAERALLLDPGSRESLRVRTDAQALVTTLRRRRHQRWIQAGVWLFVLGGVLTILLAARTRSSSSETSSATRPEPIPPPVAVAAAARPPSVRFEPLSDDLPTPVFPTPWIVPTSPSPGLRVVVDPPATIESIELRSSDVARQYARPRRIEVHADGQERFRAEYPETGPLLIPLRNRKPTGSVEITVLDTWRGRGDREFRSRVFLDSVHVTFSDASP
jgi:hypothetical protein